MSKKEVVYAWLMLIVGILLLGSATALELDHITLTQGLIQIGGCVVAGLVLSYLIWLEETRAARRGRNDRC